MIVSGCPRQRMYFDSFIQQIQSTLRWDGIANSQCFRFWIQGSGSKPLEPLNWVCKWDFLIAPDYSAPLHPWEKWVWANCQGRTQGSLTNFEVGVGDQVRLITELLTVPLSYKECKWVPLNCQGSLINFWCMDIIDGHASY